VNNDLAARALRDKCLKGDALQMVSHLDDLLEMWETLDTCYERPEKYMEEALRPIVDFRRYKNADSAAVREFYSLLRAAIKGAKGIGSRKCRAWNQIGCDGDHVMLQCKKLMSLGLSERKKVLEKSGLCTFCLKHAAELECYGRGGMSKPRCTQPGCDGEHTPSVHKLMGEENDSCHS
jgi:hypothetical protein